MSVLCDAKYFTHRRHRKRSPRVSGALFPDCRTCLSITNQLDKVTLQLGCRPIRKREGLKNDEGLTCTADRKGPDDLRGVAPTNGTSPTAIAATRDILALVR